MAPQETDTAPETETPSEIRGWRPGLDGLRAVAVLGVMAYHEPDIELSGGFLGVDLFFVLSGFLITGLLLDERHRTGTVSLRSFWNRRARRLLPALAAFLVLVVIATTILGSVDQRHDLPGGVLSSIFYVSNWNQIAQHQSYFDQFGSLSPLRHLWSLAIEEQFYLIWPIVVLACLRRSRRLLIAVTAIATVSSIGLMAYFLGDGDPSRSYYGTDTRAFSLLIGALGAIFAWHLRPSGRRTFAASVLGLAALGGALFFISDSDRWMYRGGFAAFALLSLGVIILASGETFVSRAMSHPVLRKIGFLSYALYLWHWPVRVFVTDARLHVPDNLTGHLIAISVRLLLTFALAWLSMEAIERWFRRSELGVAKFGIGWLGVGAVAVAIALIAAPSVGSTVATTTGGDQAAQRERNLSAPRVPGSPVLLTTGDSIAITLDHGIRRTFDPSITVISAGELGCALLTSPRALSFDGVWSVNGSECPDHNEYWSQLVAAQKPDVVLLLSGAWDLYARDWGNGVVVPGDEEFDRRYVEALTESLKILTTGGAEVVLMTTPCFAPAPGESAGPQHEPKRAQHLSELQRTTAEQFSENFPKSVVTLVDLNHVTCDGGFTSTRDGVNWRPDGSHFSIDGSQVAARWLLDELPASTRSRLGLSTE
jgi:peptidoglycan/LPS O-acetylase OafA/YrhL